MAEMVDQWLGSVAELSSREVPEKKPSHVVVADVAGAEVVVGVTGISGIFGDTARCW